MTEPSLVAVQRAAVERVRVDSAGARSRLALVGALERVREDAPDGPLAAALASLVAVRAFGASDTSAPAPATAPLAAWSPDDRKRRLAREGAALAVRRFDLPPERAAAALCVSPDELDVPD